MWLEREIKSRGLVKVIGGHNPYINISHEENSFWTLKFQAKVMLNNKLRRGQYKGKYEQNAVLVVSA